MPKRGFVIQKNYLFLTANNNTINGIASHQNSILVDKNKVSIGAAKS